MFEIALKSIQNDWYQPENPPGIEKWMFRGLMGSELDTSASMFGQDDMEREWHATHCALRKLVFHFLSN